MTFSAEKGPAGPPSGPTPGVVDRRRGPRVDAPLGVRILAHEATGGRPLLACGANLSSTGILCLLGTGLPPFTRVTMELLLTAPGRPSSHIRVAAVVVRSERVAGGKDTGLYETAFFFYDIDPLDADVIQAVVDGRAA